MTDRAATAPTVLRLVPVLTLLVVGLASLVWLLRRTVPRGEARTADPVEGSTSRRGFLLAAGVWAKSLGAKVLYTGVSQADFSGYPDCRRAFIRAQERMMRLAMEWPFKIVTPFMDMSKADEWALAAQLGILDVIKNETVTCYNGVPGAGCGTCPSCLLRNRGLKAFERRRAE